MFNLKYIIKYIFYSLFIHKYKIKQLKKPQKYLNYQNLK